MTEIRHQSTETGEQLRPSHTIWFINRFSTNADRYIDALEQQFKEHPGNSTWIDTSQDDESGKQLLDEILAHDQIELIIGGGDGTLHKAIDVLTMQVPSDILTSKQVAISVVGLGLENDVAHMLHGPAFNDLNLILNSKTESVRPLFIQKQAVSEVEGQNQPFYYWRPYKTAIYAFGMGATAEGARLANSPGYSDINKARPETLLAKLEQRAIHGWANFQLFRLAMKASYLDEYEQRRSDFTAVNGSRMAGILRFAVRLNKDGFYVSETNDNPLSRANSLANVLIGQGHKGVVVHGSYTFGISEPTLVHIDGENYMFEPGTYKLSESPVALNFRSALVSE